MPVWVCLAAHGADVPRCQRSLARGSSALGPGRTACRPSLEPGRPAFSSPRSSPSRPDAAEPGAATIGIIIGPAMEIRSALPQILPVAVGDAGTIVTSPDGTTWTARTSGASSALNGITWSGTQFLAVGDAGTVVTSATGIAWAVRSAP